MPQKRKEEYGNKARKWRLGKAQIETELLLMEMVKKDVNYVIKGETTWQKQAYMGV